jgi:lipid II:glycine glycyltransferase (peptidoglycan interpeptide bridge formation enzyme)
LLHEGKRVERLGIFDKDEMVAIVQLYYSNLPFGWHYAFAPKGPIVSIRYQVSSIKIYETLKEYLKSKNCIFLRIEPFSIPEQSSLHFKKSINLHMPTTLLLDLQKSTDQLLSEMHQKTRYNIRLAQKKGLVVSEKKDSETFWRLSQETSARDKFRLHPKEHYEAMLNSSSIYQLSLQLEGNTIVSGIFVGFGDTFSYLHGASAYAHRSLMAPYLLQWSAIEQAKQLGFKWYDFYGLAPEERSNERWQTELVSPENYHFDPQSEDAGFTRFKLGFGGIVEAMPGTWDLIIDQKKYQRYQLFRKIRRFLKFLP